MRGKLVGVAALVALLGAFGPVPIAGASDGEDELEGVVESLPGTADFVGDWVVSGVTVHVTTDTDIEQEDGAVAVGANVEVEGSALPDGSITATKIEVSEDADDDDFGEMEFEGFVEALPATPDLVGDWTVSGRIVHVTTATEIEEEHGAIAVGTAVEVEGLAEADGSITAREIEAIDEDDCDEDSVTLSGTATSVPGGDHTGKWRVSHHAVKVRDATRIVHERRLSEGSTVRVVGTSRANGSISASKIVVRS